MILMSGIVSILSWRLAAAVRHPHFGHELGLMWFALKVLSVCS